MMRLCVLFILCMLQTVTGQEQKPEEKLASIEGKVVHSMSREPVRRANLTLMPMRSASKGVVAGVPQMINGATDAEGKFIFDKLEPGRYLLSAEKAGFGRQQYGSRGAGMFSPGSPLTLSPGQKMTGVEFKLVPQAVISGRVIDEHGDPVTRAMVQVLRQVPFSRQPMGTMAAPVNDIGEFRAGNLAPGKYLLRVEQRPSMGTPQQAPQGAERLDYVVTYYPGVTDATAATPIEVSAGQEVPGVEIRLQKARVYRVSGKALGITPDPMGRTSVSLQPQRSGGPFFSMQFGGNVKADGSFVIPTVQPGSYSLTLMSMDQGRPRMLGRVPVSVTNQDVENVVIQAGSPLQLTGRMIADGDAASKLTGQVMLQSIDGMPFGSMPAHVGEDGTFKLENVSKDRHNVVVMGLPEGMYVSSIRAGNLEVIEHGLDLANVETAPALEIRVSSKGATVEGVVQSEDKPAAGAIVTLLPHPLTDRTSPMLRKTANTDQSGRFSITGIAPGEYRAYALEQYLPFQFMEPDDLKQIEPFAVALKLKPEAREALELKLAVPQTK